MADLTPAQRGSLIEGLATWLNDKIRDERNHVEVEIVSGVTADFAQDLLSPRVSQNETATLTVRINGGARNAQVA